MQYQTGERKFDHLIDPRDFASHARLNGDVMQHTCSAACPDVLQSSIAKQILLDTPQVDDLHRQISLLNQTPTPDVRCLYACYMNSPDTQMKWSAAEHRRCSRSVLYLFSASTALPNYRLPAGSDSFCSCCLDFRVRAIAYPRLAACRRIVIVYSPLQSHCWS